MDTRRKSLLEAMVRVVGEKGYRATSVADVIAAADTSRSTFYKHFDDKHDCFLVDRPIRTDERNGIGVAC